MATSLFNINLTLPLVLVVFLVFVQVFKAIFFDPLMKIKEQRKLTLQHLNADVDYGSRNTFTLEDRLKQEELSTQRLIQDAYQTQVTKAQMKSAEDIQDRKQSLATELTAHVDLETSHAKELQNTLIAQPDDLIQRITKKVLSASV